MSSNLFQLESSKPFSESLIWQLNRDFYQKQGVNAFSDHIVPHNLTSSSLVGETYSELIFGVLNDLASQGKTTEKVYILELGAGHGRLAFHIIHHLERLIDNSNIVLPPYCYVLSDIVEESLQYFLDHPQFVALFNKGILDVAYFDAVGKSDIVLRYSNEMISSHSIEQPLIAIANYFFDSIPTDLFYIKDDTISKCSVSVHSAVDPITIDSIKVIDNISLAYSLELIELPFYDDDISNEILRDYVESLNDVYLFFPKTSMKCIDNLQDLSKEGLILLTLDKGYHSLDGLRSLKKPDVINHGSFSISVNFHALDSHCLMQGGRSLFPSYSNFHMEIACLFYEANYGNYSYTTEAFHKYVDRYGPDDFNTLKHNAYRNISRISTREILSLYRLSAYDSNFFTKLMPQLKELSKAITLKERTRISETMHKVWELYFFIGESYDLAYEMGSLFYDLGFYESGIEFFDHSTALHGIKPDTLYNKVLSYYQLRQDKLFAETLKEAKSLFPDFSKFEELDKLDMSAT